MRRYKFKIQGLSPAVWKVVSITNYRTSLVLCQQLLFFFFFLKSSHPIPWNVCKSNTVWHKNFTSLLVSLISLTEGQMTHDKTHLLVCHCLLYWYCAKVWNIPIPVQSHTRLDSCYFSCILLSLSIFMSLTEMSSFSLRLRSSHTFIGGPSRVGIHQGPSLSPATLQCQWTMVGQRQSSLHVLVCVWVAVLCAHTHVCF